SYVRLHVVNAIDVIFVREVMIYAKSSEISCRPARKQGLKRFTIWYLYFPVAGIDGHGGADFRKVSANQLLDIRVKQARWDGDELLPGALIRILRNLSSSQRDACRDIRKRRGIQGGVVAHPQRRMGQPTACKAYWQSRVISLIGRKEP